MDGAAEQLSPGRDGAGPHSGCFDQQGFRRRDRPRQGQPVRQPFSDEIDDVLGTARS